MFNSHLWCVAVGCCALFVFVVSEIKQIEQAMPPSDSHERRTRHLWCLLRFPPAAAPSHPASTRRQSWGTPTCLCRPGRPSDIPFFHLGCSPSPFPERYTTSSTPLFTSFHSFPLASTSNFTMVWVKKKKKKKESHVFCNEHYHRQEIKYYLNNSALITNLDICGY